MIEIPSCPRAELRLAGGAPMSRYLAAQIFRRHGPDGHHFYFPNAWRVVATSHKMHEAGWPVGTDLEARVDLVADDVGIPRSSLRKWSHAGPTSDDSGVCSMAIVIASEARHRLFSLSEGLADFTGHRELSLALEQLVDLWRRECARELMLTTGRT